MNPVEWNPKPNGVWMLWSLLGCEVIVACEHGNGEQKRKHKKRRINKKWLKRYGVYSGQILDRDQILVTKEPKRAYVTRDTYNKLKAAAKAFQEEAYRGVDYAPGESLTGGCGVGDCFCRLPRSKYDWWMYRKGNGI